MKPNFSSYLGAEISNRGGYLDGSPFLINSKLDESKPYGYTTSDLKSDYLSRSELQQRTTAPILSQSQYLNQGYPKHN